MLMQFASKCSIFELPESGVKITSLKILDTGLVSLDRVTCIMVLSVWTACNCSLQLYVHLENMVPTV